MITSIREAFEAIGADVLTRLAGDSFEIDVQRSGDREVYQLTYPLGDSIQADVLDVKPRLRHLVLDVSGWRLPISGRYLCGHDEQHWFVASLPFGQRSTTVRGAMETLKPEIVLREQQRKGVRHRRNRRKTAAYVRQGEWFFLPRPMMHVGELASRNGQLIRRLGCRSGEALQRQEAHDHLQAVAKPVIEFLRHQVLLQGENAHLAEEFFLAQERGGQGGPVRLTRGRMGIGMAELTFVRQV